MSVAVSPPAMIESAPASASLPSGCCVRGLNLAQLKLIIQHRALDLGLGFLGVGCGPHCLGLQFLQLKLSRNLS